MTERGRSDVTTDIDTEADRRDCPHNLSRVISGGMGRGKKQTVRQAGKAMSAPLPPWPSMTRGEMI